ncbi:hypothetical protein N9Z27_02145 [Alphaproteobacteria bacterium]|nr:hypothetical protein [Alphaproteobacteria bacterium]
MVLKIRHFLPFILFLAIAVPAMAQGGGGGQENKGIPDSCNPDVMEVMNLRAKLEGEREMEVAQALILRPDSVLEYSCFAENVKLLGASAENMFSGNKPPNRDLFYGQPPDFTPKDAYQPTIRSEQGPKPEKEGQDSEGIKETSAQDSSDNDEKYPGPEHFANNISKMEEGGERGNMVMDSLYHYLDGNFRHTPLGGVRPGQYNGQSGGEGGRNICDVMNVVWNFAKCDDYYMEIGFEQLKDFPDQYDAWSEEWAQCGRQKVQSQEWEDAIRAVNPAPNGSAGVDVNTSGGGNGKTAFIPQIKGDSCSAAKAVKTGVTVNFDGSPRPEGVCLRAGCFYNNGTCQ